MALIRNENGPLHLFVVQGTALPREILEQIRQLRQTSLQNIILIVLEYWRRETKAFWNARPLGTEC
jgi:hypothetical protein